MTRALAPVAVLGLALAACSVDVEGAQCRTTGSTAECPSGQACGNDQRCSERAETCTAQQTRCTPGSTRCLDGQHLDTCTTADVACGSWETTSCADLGLLCGTTGPTAACECQGGFSGPEFAADPDAGSLTSEAPFATGAASPPQCRYKRLTDAVARAATIASPGGGAVQVYGGAGGQHVFGADTADGAISIPANVTVHGASGGVTILRPAASSGETLVTLAGALEGFRVERGTGDAVAVATSCVGGGRPALTDVAVDGDGVLTVGVDVSGTCGADLADVEVSNVSGPALRIGADASAIVSVYGGALKDSGVGARVTGGKVTFGAEGDPSGRVEIAGNGAEGVLFTGIGTGIDAQIDGASIFANGGTGVVVDVVSPSSKLAMRGCDVYSNGATAARFYGGATQRQAGGVLVRQAQLAAFTFAANRIYANRFDQVGFASSGAWSISPGACGIASNRFACVPVAAYSVSILGTGTVNANANAWPIEPPDTTVNGSVTTAGYCSNEAGLPPAPQCPAP